MPTTDVAPEEENSHSVAQKIHLMLPRKESTAASLLSWSSTLSTQTILTDEDEYPDYLRLILTSRVYNALPETPLTTAVDLSRKMGYQVFLKREDLQPSLSSKIRGVYNKMACIPTEERWRGVVTCSVGDHAVAVAYVAKLLSMPSVIIMLDRVPGIKNQQCSRLEATVMMCGSDAEATEQRQRLQSQNGMTYIPASHDTHVISGQGTVGLELIKQWKGSHVTAVFCSMANLDLIAGVSVFLKRVAPEIKVIAVEVNDKVARLESMGRNRSLALKRFAVAEAAALLHPIQGEAFRLCREHVDGIMSVTIEEVHEAIKDIYEETRSMADSSGAIGLAGLKKYAAMYSEDQRKKPALCTIISGADVRFDKLNSLVDRNYFRENEQLLLL